jgi:hypothetical protein
MTNYEVGLAVFMDQYLARIVVSHSQVSPARLISNNT